MSADENLKIPKETEEICNAKKISEDRVSEGRNTAAGFTCVLMYDCCN